MSRIHPYNENMYIYTIVVSCQSGLLYVYKIIVATIIQNCWINVFLINVVKEEAIDDLARLQARSSCNP